MASIEDHHEELESITREIAKETEKIAIVHGEKRKNKYKFIKSRINRGKVVLRSLKLETRGLAEEKQQKWKDIAAKYELKLNEALTELEFAMNQDQKQADADEDFFDNDGNVSAAHKTTKQIHDKVLKVQDTDIKMLEGMVTEVNEMNTLGAETLTTMKTQSEQLGRIEVGIGEIEGSLKEAGRELRTLARNMARDKICLGFTLLAAIALIIVVFYGIFYDKSGNTIVPDSLKRTDTAGTISSWFSGLFDNADSEAAASDTTTFQTN